MSSESEGLVVLKLDDDFAESRSVLRIGPHGDTEVVRIETPYPYPGPIRRLAYYLVLGWKWERP